MARQREMAFDEHYPVVLRTCLRILGDPDDAADAAQETFRRALEHDLTVLTDPPRWLKAVARNVCRDELRHRRRAQVCCAVAADGVADPERVVVGRTLVGDLLGRLTPAERRVVTARVIDDRPAPELAASLGIAPSTTRVLLARGLGKLRHYLTDSQTALGGAGIAAAGAMRRAYRALRCLVEPQGLAVLQGVTAVIVTAAVAALSSSAAHAPGAPVARGAAVVALGPAQPVAAQTVARTAAPPAAHVVAPPLSSGPSTRPQPPSPSPPPSSGPTALLPSPPPGPIAQSNPPQQSPHVGPVYILVGPSPQYWAWVDSYAQDVGLFATRCGLPHC